MSIESLRNIEKAGESAFSGFVHCAAASYTPTGNGSGATSIAMPTLNPMGVVTGRAVSAFNLLSRVRRLGYVSAATSAAFCGHYSTAAQFTTGNGAGLGGFSYSCRFAATDAASIPGATMFVGLTASTAAPTNVEPTTILNSIGVAQLSASSNQLYIVCNGSSAQTPIPLGLNFPPMTAAGASNGVFYDLTLSSLSTLDGVVSYRLERLGTPFVAEGIITPVTAGTQTPSSSTLLAHRAQRCNNTTALVCGLDFAGVSIETDF